MFIVCRIKCFRGYESRHSCITKIEYQPADDKINKMACASKEDQPGHPLSLIRVSLCCPHEESSCPCLPFKRTAKALI